MKLRMLSALAVAVMVVGAASGCVPATSPSPSPTPTFATEAEAFAAAEETYRAYVDALNQIDLTNPSSFDAVFGWTSGELNATDRKNFSEWHAEGYAVSGSALVTQVQPVGFVPAVEPTVTIEACYDVSDVDVRDSSGASVVSSTRPDIQYLRISLSNSQVTPTKLTVSDISAGEGALPC